MKQWLPFNVLLIVTLAVTGLTVFYNLVLRESFGVMIEYNLPVPQAAESSQSQPVASKPESELASERRYTVEYEVEQTPLPEDETDFLQEQEEDSDEITSVTFPLEINSATEEQLKFIPQVGDVTAQRIVQYRDVLGGYSELEQLMEIRGIGEKMYLRLAPYLYIEGQWEPESQVEE